ncbi:TerD family protein [Streptomyces erythrochromogenes]|uniref:TerD family protein n=1 Tax=Streptomyces erythrochromogenes TaxID=285574 RepID=UPI0037014EAA
MQTTSLRKGENIGLATAPVVLAVSVHGLAADVSALLLGTDGRVRSDEDLVFYNHPAQDGVSIVGPVVTADLVRVPAVTTAPDFTSGETVVVLAELYRREGGWKIRAVGQGYASGLAGLATDYGVDVESEPDAAAAPLPAQGQRNPTPAQPTVALSTVERVAPGLLSPARQASKALVDRAITNQRAAVYLILDHDLHMEELYESFAVQAFAERVLALSATLDDDGTVPVVFSSGREPFLEEIRLDNYRGRIGQLHTQVDWGWGDVAFYDASKNPGSVPDERFYAGPVDAFATWLRP